MLSLPLSRFFPAFLCVLASFSWQSAGAAEAAGQVFHNARIYTLNAAQPWADTLAIADDAIVYVGDYAGAAAYIDADTRQTDLGGKMMLPGFIDTHMHVGDTIPYIFAAALGPGMSPDEAIATIARHATAYPEQNPVIGSGFLGAAFGELGPTAADLDRAVPDRPAIMFDEGFHSAWINSRAMALVGLDADTADPVPGVHYYKRYPDGTPTGWLIEGAAFNWVSEKLEVTTADSLEAGASEFLGTLSAMGITAAFDAGMIDGGEKTLALFERLVAEQRLPLRVVGSLYVNTVQKLATAAVDLADLNARFNSEFFDVRTLKVSLDGTVEAQTAFMLEPYLKPAGHLAQPLVPPQEATAAVVRAAADNIDVHLHTLGDGAVRLGLDMVEQARRSHPDTHSRFTLCHVQIVNPADVPRFGELGVIAQSTPSWYVYDDIALEFLGEERLQQHYPLRSIAAGGARITLGSDYPASWIGLDGLNPLFNIEMALTRRPPGDPDFIPQPRASEVISLSQAIRGYTLDAAYQLHLEDDIGSLEVGKQADLVVLSDNLFELDPYAIHRARVVLTMVNGRVVYTAAE
ncbi:hydrolase [Kineobactrum sediminis]|uniref:Hydrolase n=1 Tax=Kineobactrum sediminis TaxID=1905677 RepID=A0A2N5Y4S3_9GAMM|nr:amidohydrolase [Kineobactrum sediminis]PLW83397.1 hydrolase [Kineobactrum sediminis]